MKVSFKRPQIFIKIKLNLFVFLVGTAVSERKMTKKTFMVNFTFGIYAFTIFIFAYFKSPHKIFFIH